MQWVPVSSSNVAAIAYDSREKLLYVQFHSGSVYVYYDVPPQVYLSFVNAPSKGQFVWRVLRNQGRDNAYRYSRVA